MPKDTCILSIYIPYKLHLQKTIIFIHVNEVELEMVVDLHTYVGNECITVPWSSFQKTNYTTPIC